MNPFLYSHPWIFVVATTILIAVFLALAIRQQRKLENVTSKAVVNGNAAGGWLVQYRFGAGLWMPCVTLDCKMNPVIAMFVKSEDAFSFMKQRAEQNRLASRDERRRYRVTSAVTEAA